MRLSTTCAAFAAALTTMAAAGAASAQDAAVAFNAAVTSDYVFRGISQSNEDPAVQAGVDLTIGGLYAGGWASTVDFGDDTDAEVDLYGGVRTEAGGFALDFGGVAYLYTDAPGGGGYDYFELKAAASRAIGPITAGAVIYYSPDFFGADEAATYIEANAAYAVTDKLTISGAVGEQFLDVTDDYLTYNVGASYALTSNLVGDVRYHNTDIDGLGIAEDRVVATIKVLY